LALERFALRTLCCLPPFHLPQVNAVIPVKIVSVHSAVLS
jgi:hypothetical protein